MGKRYLHPGCQAIGFPFLRRSDIRWFFCGMCTSKRTVHVCVCVRCTHSHLCLLSSSLHHEQRSRMSFSPTWLSAEGDRICYIRDKVTENLGWGRSLSHAARTTLFSVLSQKANPNLCPSTHSPLNFHSEWRCLCWWNRYIQIIKLLCCVFSFLTKSMQF